jgi:ankyrin repeat protein
MANSLELVRLLLDRGADPNRRNDYGWTKLHQAGYSNGRELAEVMLAARARTDLSARGDGGTPLIAALFWGHPTSSTFSASSRETSASPRASASST